MDWLGFLGALVPLALGGLGYLLMKFWFEPVARYHEKKRQVHVDLIYYANALSFGRDVNPRDRTDPHVQRVWKRMDVNRKRSAELLAAYRELPPWYRRILAQRGEDPERAASELIALSNNYEPGGGIEPMRCVTSALGLPRFS